MRMLCTRCQGKPATGETREVSMKRNVIGIVVAIVVVLFFLVSAATFVYYHPGTKDSVVLGDLQYSDRFSPTRPELIRVLNRRSWIITDAETRSEYLVIEGCGIVKLTK